MNDTIEDNSPLSPYKIITHKIQQIQDQSDQILNKGVVSKYQDTQGSKSNSIR